MRRLPKIKVGQCYMHLPRQEVYKVVSSIHGDSYSIKILNRDPAAYYDRVTVGSLFHANSKPIRRLEAIYYGFAKV
jgi:hypothetical protein